MNIYASYINANMRACGGTTILVDEKCNYLESLRRILKEQPACVQQVYWKMLFERYCDDDNISGIVAKKYNCTINSGSKKCSLQLE